MQSLSLLHLIEKFAEIRRQVPLRSLTAVGLGIPTCFFRIEPVSIAECFAFCAETTFPFLKWGYVGLPPKPAWGFDLGNSHRGAVLCLRQTRPLRERASAPCDFRHAEPRTAGAWLQSPTPSKGLRSLCPLSAARGCTKRNHSIKSD